MITIAFPETIETRLANAAQKLGKSREFCVQEAVVEYLDDLEDLAIAEQRMQSFDPEKAISHEEIMRKYGAP